MSIKQHIEDARFLIKAGRHLGALTILTVAVAGSSRLLFPKGVKSLEDPKNKMSDGEAFKLFLGGRIRRIVNNVREDAEWGESGFTVKLDGKVQSIESILYHRYRCDLIHEAILSKGIEFSDSSAERNTIENNGVRVGITVGESLILDYGWLDVLEKAVVEAPCNGVEFGIEHQTLRIRDGLNEDELEQRMNEKYRAAGAKFKIMKDAVWVLSDRVILEATDEQLIKLFLSKVRTGEICGGAVSLLASRALTTTSGILTINGMAMLREIAEAYALRPR